MRRLLVVAVGLVIGALVFSACGGGEVLTPTSTAAPTPTPTPTPTPHPGAVLPELVKVADLPGGDIVDLAFAASKPNVVYLASFTNAMGIWRSDDAGETWRQVLADSAAGGPAHIHRIAVHPTDPDVVLIAGPRNLIKMVMAEGGVQWKSVYPPVVPAEDPTIHMFAPAFSPSMPSVAYVAHKQGNILKSTDGGDTWQAVSRIESEGRIASIAVDPRRPDTVYVGAGVTVFKSTDGGGEWQPVLAQGTDGAPSDFAISPASSDVVFAATPGGLFKTSDGGATWRRTLDHKAHSVQVAPSDSRVVYAGTPEGVFKSSDGGETWVPHTTGMDYINVGPLAVHPTDPNTVIAGSNINLWTRYGGPFPASTQGEGIYKTTDGGISWVRKGNEFIDVDVIEVAVDPDNPDVVYVGTRCSRGLYRSVDGGTSWAVRATDHQHTTHYTMRLAVTMDSVLWLTSSYGMDWSSDGGQTLQATLDKQRRHFHGIAISPHDPRLMFVGTVSQGFDPLQVQATYYPGARILRSTDGGRTWLEVGEGFPSGADTAIEDFAFDPFDPEVIYASTSTHHRITGVLSDTLGIYKSSDGGQTWTPANTGLADKNVHSIVASPVKEGLLYAGTTTGVFRSTDGGGTWVYIGLSEHVHRLLIDPAEPSFLYAGTDNGLFWSFNGGDTWQRLESVPAKPVTGLAMDAQGRVLYAAVNTVGVFKGVKP